MPVLGALPVASHAAGLVDGQRRRRQQEQQGGGRMQHRGWVAQPAKATTGQGRRCHDVAQVLENVGSEVVTHLVGIPFGAPEQALDTDGNGGKIKSATTTATFDVVPPTAPTITNVTDDVGTVTGTVRSV